MKIIVIGTGFIGNHLIKKLQDLKHEVTIFHHDDKIEIKEADYIFFLQSYGNHYHQKDEYQTIKANIIDYLKLLRLTSDIQYRGLIYFSTSSVILPVQTAYSDAKFIGEIIGRRFYKKYNKPVVSIRPSSIYGQGEADFRFIPTIINHLKSGKPMPLTAGNHDWLYIEDFIDGVIKVMENSQTLAGKSVPIGTGIKTSNYDVLKILMEISGKTIKTHHSPKVKREYDTKNWVADITLMKSLGWKPKYTLREGLKKTYDHFSKKNN